MSGHESWRPVPLPGRVRGAPLTALAVTLHDAVERAPVAVVQALLKQGGVDLPWSAVEEAWAVEQLEYLLLLGFG